MFFLSCVMLMNMLIVFKELSNYQWNSIVVIFVHLHSNSVHYNFCEWEYFRAKNNGAE